MDGEERLLVRLSSQDLILLNELVIRGKFSNEAEAVRSIVEQYLNDKFTAEEIGSITNASKIRDGLDLDLVLPEGENASAVLGDIIRSGIDKSVKED